MPLTDLAIRGFKPAEKPYKKSLAIVANEPTSRLDPVVQRETMLLLRDLVDEKGLGLVLISHDARMIGALADDHVILGRS